MKIQEINDKTKKTASKKRPREETDDDPCFSPRSAARVPTTMTRPATRREWNLRWTTTSTASS